MSWLSGLLGSGAGDLVTGVASAIDRFVETGEEKKAAEALMMKIQQEPDKWQAEINKIEAGHRSMFVAGWRPGVGWICVLALFWGWILRPVVETVMATTGHQIILPAIQTNEAISLVMALLGMGALRTYEKQKGLTG